MKEDTKRWIVTASDGSVYDVGAPYWRIEDGALIFYAHPKFWVESMLCMYSPHEWKRCEPEVPYDAS